MVFVRQVHSWHRGAFLAVGVVLVHVVLWLTMRYSVAIIKVIKESGVLLVTRISGLLLSAIAVQMVANAVRAFIRAG
jgi:multiple antibiotic resistance protein